MSLRLFSNQRITPGSYFTQANEEMTGLRIVFRWTVRNIGPGTCSGRGTLRDANGRVLLTQDVSVPVGETLPGEIVYDSSVPPGAYIDLTGFTGTGLITVDAVDLDPPTANLAGSGWANYAHSSAVQAIPKNAWTTILNDELGTATRLTIKDFLPIGIPDLFDVTNNRFDTTYVTVGSQIEFRVNLSINPSQNNRTASLRLNFNDASIPLTWNFEMKQPTMKDGAGVDYQIIETFNFFVSRVWTESLVIIPQIFCTTASNITVVGYYMRIN